MFWIIILIVLIICFLRAESFDNVPKLPPPFDVLYQQSGKLAKLLQQQNHEAINKFIIELDPKIHQCDTYKKKGLYCYQIDQLVQGLINIVEEYKQNYPLRDLVNKTVTLHSKALEFGIRNSA